MVRMKVLLAAAAIFTSCCAAESIAGPPRVEGLAPRARLLKGAAQDPVSRALLSVSCLLEEVRRPTGGPSTECSTAHDRELYSMLVYLGHESMRDRLEPSVVRRAALQVRGGKERDLLTLLLGLTGDRDVTPALASYSTDPSRPPYLRAVAVRALEYIRDSRTIDALLKILETDPAWERASKHSVGRDGRSSFKVFIVRAAAQQALRSFARDNLLNDELEQRVEQAVVGMEFTNDEWRELRLRVAAEDAARVEAELRSIR